MFCENHDEVGCYTCMAVEHRLCQDVFFIPDFMKTRAAGVKEFLQYFTDIEQKLQLFHERFLDWRGSLRSSKENELKKISESRKSLEKKIKEAEQLAFREVEKCFEGLDKDLQTNMESIENELETIENTKRRIKSASQNSSQAFVLMKNNLKNAKTAYETTSKVKVNHGIEFVPNLGLQDQMCLGNILQCSLCKFTKKGNIDITTGSESQYNDTLGSCVLLDGSVVLADYTRKKLQRIDSKTLSVSDQYSLDTSPWGVCRLDAKEIAVCLPFVKRIQIFSVEEQFTPSRSITVEFGCKAISYIENKFYLSDEAYVYVCNEEGNILKTFHADSAGKTLFSDIFSICVSIDSKQIYICDRKQGVLTLRDKGNVYNVVSAEIGSPNGVTTDDMGNVFVCGFTSKDLIQLDKLGNFSGIVIKKSSDAPQSICFDPTLSRLYIPYYTRNTVEVFEAEF